MSEHRLQTIDAGEVIINDEENFWITALAGSAAAVGGLCHGWLFQPGRVVLLAGRIRLADSHLNCFLVAKAPLNASRRRSQHRSANYGKILWKNNYLQR